MSFSVKSGLRKMIGRQVAELDPVVGQHQDKVVRRGGIVGQPSGQRDADGHFHIFGEPEQNIVHQRAFALVQMDVLNAVERGDGKVNLFSRRIQRIGCKPGQSAHVAHVLRRQSHGIILVSKCAIPCGAPWSELANRR